MEIELFAQYVKGLGYPYTFLTDNEYIWKLRFKIIKESDVADRSIARMIGMDEYVYLNFMANKFNAKYIHGIYFDDKQKAIEACEYLNSLIILNKLVGEN